MARLSRYLDRLYEWRALRAYSQVDLAKRAGIAFTTVNRLERGHFPATPLTMRKLARALKVQPVDLFTADLVRHTT